MMNRRRASAALTIVTLGILAGGAPTLRAEPAGSAAVAAPMRIEARFVDAAGGADAGWGATGQIVLPLNPADPGLLRWGQDRVVATYPARQAVTLAPAGRGLLRVGRDIPFAGWFLRHGTRCGWLEPKTQWRDVESALEVEACPPHADGSVCVALTPEFTFLAGRARQTVSFPGERVEVALVPGVETRFVADGARGEFFARLLAGYDPLRRVGPVGMVLRADHADLNASAQP